MVQRVLAGRENLADHAVGCRANRGNRQDFALGEIREQPRDPPDLPGRLLVSPVARGRAMHLRKVVEHVGNLLVSVVHDASANGGY
jgi:hypothetical protein